MDSGKFDERVRSYCKENHIMGMLRITVKDEILYKGAYGYANLEKKEEFSDGTLFNFYSLSKPFCAIGLLLLKDKGLVDLDAHPGRYVKETADFDKRLTVRQVLQHVSGLPDFSDYPELVKSIGRCLGADIKKQIVHLTERGMKFAPGTQGNYNNFNFSLAALIIEEVSGMKYADYMHKEVHLPLGMKTAFIDSSEDFGPMRAMGYELDGESLVAVGKDLNFMFGGGDAVGTVDDVYALNRAIKQGLLLKEDTWREALTPTKIHVFGMGCMNYDWHGMARINHNGGSVGFRTLHFQIPERDFDVIFLSNSGFGDARNAISDMIYDHFFDGDGKVDVRVAMDEGYIPSV